MTVIVKNIVLGKTVENTQTTQYTASNVTTIIGYHHRQVHGDQLQRQCCNDLGQLGHHCRVRWQQQPDHQDQDASAVRGLHLPRTGGAGFEQWRLHQYNRRNRQRHQHARQWS